MTSDADDCANGIENTARSRRTPTRTRGTTRAIDSIEVLCPDLELEKSGSDPVSAGDDVSFTLMVTNHGEGEAKNVVLTDNLPGRWPQHLGHHAGTVGIDATDCGIVADVLTCSIDSLAAGASFSVTVGGDDGLREPARASRTTHRS